MSRETNLYLDLLKKWGTIPLTKQIGDLDKASERDAPLDQVGQPLKQGCEIEVALEPGFHVGTELMRWHGKKRTNMIITAVSRKRPL